MMQSETPPSPEALLEQARSLPFSTRGRLLAYSETMILLRSKGMSYHQIASYLTVNGVPCCSASVFRAFTKIKNEKSSS